MTVPADDLLDLERASWEALSTSGQAARGLYDELLADDVLMLFPGGMVIDDRDVVVQSMDQADWNSYELSDERVLPLGDDAAVVAYRVHATKGDGSHYDALLNSTYVRAGEDWRLVLHQQTPV